MKNIFFVLLFAPCLIFGQERDSSSVQEVLINYTLQIGKIADFGETSVKFIKIVSDSRCPKNVTCIWQGEAKVLIGIFNNEEMVDQKVIVIPKVREQYAFFGKQDLLLKFFSLSPYPDATDPIQPEEYVLRFSLSGDFSKD